MSEIERGAGSFTAEQLLLILEIFNVGVDTFAPSAPERSSALQNALARLGARHLRESGDVIPSERLDEVATAIRETLVHAESPRLIAALAPVLVLHIDRIGPGSIAARLAEVGLERRWVWLLENTLEAVRRERAAKLPRIWERRYRRAEVVLELFVQSAGAHSNRAGQLDAPMDLLDPHVRSRRTVDELVASSSGISKRWGIVTSLQPEDFVDALRGARVGD